MTSGLRVALVDHKASLSICFAPHMTFVGLHYAGDVLKTSLMLY